MRLTKSLTFIILFITGMSGINATAQTGQLNITRVQQMTNLPSPNVMRDWKEVAVRYDSLIFSLNATGQYLPMMHLSANGINYPALQPILLDSYVGSASSGNQAEAINIIPSLVGASLMGIDKSSQNGTNWVLKAKDFFNKANGQNVYLNGASVSSGSDWWYDLMPNIFFYQLYSQYPNTTDFAEQFTTIADRWLTAVHTLGGSTTPWTIPDLDHRGFNLITGMPNNNGVSEPESAGTIAWLLYNAYHKTNDKKYLEGAEMALTFLSGLNANPAYEIQLPYGTFVAAKMNAELGTHYNIEKMVNWSFDQSSKRNWGTIVGSWGDSGNIDVSGLVGEVDNPSTGYAFAMNGFEQAAALVPMVKYDKRFARAVGKWTLHLANASRLFYPGFLPQANQDDFAWSAAHDPNSVIPYEALKQSTGGKNLYGTGDAKRNGWAATNLGLYGGSHVGYLAAVVEPTDVDGILLLDVNKTDFFGKNSFPSFIVYNPYATAKQVTLPLGAQSYDIYDALSETVIGNGVTGNLPISVPADEAMLLVYLPQGSTPVASGGKLYVGDEVVDYHYGYDFSGSLRIQSLTAQDTLVEFNQQVPIYSSIESPSGTVTYNWYTNNVLTSTSSTGAFTFIAPVVAGDYLLRLEVTSGITTVKDSLSIEVVAHIPVAPVISAIVPDAMWYYSGTVATLVCAASHAEDAVYEWTLSGGSVLSQRDSLIQWTLPASEGLLGVTCKVTNVDGLTTTASTNVLLKIMSSGTTAPTAYYPLDGDVLDYSGNGHDAVLQGPIPTVDERGESVKAYLFSSATDVIYVPNESSLNFQNEITLSFWVRLDGVPEEIYLLSHGSYERRWKVSILPNGKLRWTTKTSSATTDLDSTFPLLLNHFYHITTSYTGYSMELYIDGQMEAFRAGTGLLSTTTKAISFGKKEVGIEDYFLRGTLDEVRIYDQALAPNEIETLKTLWNTVTGIHEVHPANIVYPNPSKGEFTITSVYEPVLNVELTDATGRKIEAAYSYSEESHTLHLEVGSNATGLVILRIQTSTEVVMKKVLIIH